MLSIKDLKFIIIVLIPIGLSHCTENSFNNELSSLAQKVAKPGSVVFAIDEGRSLSYIQKFIELGADINGGYQNGNDRITPLMFAIVKNRVDVSQILIANGAALSPRFKGYSAYDFAYYEDKAKILMMIEQAEARK